MDLFNNISDKDKNFLPYDGTVNYHGIIMSSYNANVFLSYLLNEILWDFDKAIIFGKLITTKRKVAWYGEKEFEYTYSRITKKANIWTPQLLVLKKIRQPLACPPKTPPPPACPRSPAFSKTAGGSPAARRSSGYGRPARAFRTSLSGFWSTGNSGYGRHWGRGGGYCACSIPRPPKRKVQGELTMGFLSICFQKKCGRGRPSNPFWKPSLLKTASQNPSDWLGQMAGIILDWAWY